MALITVGAILPRHGSSVLEVDSMELPACQVGLPELDFRCLAFPELPWSVHTADFHDQLGSR